MDLYENLRDETVARLIEKFGVAVSFKRKINREYDAASGRMVQADGEPETLTIDTFALRIGPVSVLRGTGEYVEGMTLGWKEGLLMSGKDLVDVDVTALDKIVYKGKECAILKKVPVQPGDVVIAYKLGIVLK